MTLRPATDADHAALADLWNHFIRHTTVTFSPEEKTAKTVAQLVAQRRAAGRELFVLRDGNAIGLSTYDQFRSGIGYAHAMEHTILLSPGLRGKGAGRAMMTAVEEHARAGGAHTLFAAVSGENEAGIAFHARMGFDITARYPEAGRKFGRWLDLVLMMKLL